MAINTITFIKNTEPHNDNPSITFYDVCWGENEFVILGHIGIRPRNNGYFELCRCNIISRYRGHRLMPLVVSQFMSTCAAALFRISTNNPIMHKVAMGLGFKYRVGKTLCSERLIGVWEYDMRDNIDYNIWVMESRCRVEWFNLNAQATQYLEEVYAREMGAE